MNAAKLAEAVAGYSLTLYAIWLMGRLWRHLRQPHSPPSELDQQRHGYPRRPPPPGHNCGRPHKAVYVFEGGCMYIWDGRTGRFEHIPCGRTDFDVAEWEARLTQ